MTPHSFKMFMKFVIFITVMIWFVTVAWVFTVESGEKKWKKEILITKWCDDLEIVTKFLTILNTDQPEDALVFIRKHITNGTCTKLPPGVLVLFSPQTIARRFPNILFGFVVIRGRLIKPNKTLGSEVYLLLPISKLDDLRSETKPTNALKEV